MQKWQENNFRQKVAADSVYALWVKNFIEITLSCTVSKMNTFLHFRHCKIQKTAITHLATEVHL